MSASTDKGLNSKTGAAVVGGHHTDIVVTTFQDKVFVVLTQYEKLGTLVLLTKDKSLEESSGIATYTTKVLLGKDDDITNMIARNLVEKIPTSKPVLFALALKDTSPQTVKELGNLLEQYKPCDTADT